MRSDNIVRSRVIGTTMRCVPDISDGKVFVADESGRVHCLNASNGENYLELSRYLPRKYRERTLRLLME